jgi:hypothetical protein
MEQLAEGLLSLSGSAALALLFALPALEAPAFLGLVLPGELALLLGGAVLVVLAVAWLLRRLARRHDDEPRQPVTSGGAATAELGAVGRQPWVALGSEAPESRAPLLLLLAARTRPQPAVTLSSSSLRLRGRG